MRAARFLWDKPPQTPKKCDWKAKTDFEDLSHFFSLMSKGPIWDVLSIKETVFFWYVRESITGITTALQKQQNGIRFWPETRSFCSVGLCWQEGARSAEWHKSLPSKTGTRRSAQRSAWHFHRHGETINPVFHLEWAGEEMMRCLLLLLSDFYFIYFGFLCFIIVQSSCKTEPNWG